MENDNLLQRFPSRTRAKSDPYKVRVRRILLFVIKIEREKTNDRQSPLQDRGKPHRLRGRAVNKANTMDNSYKGNNRGQPRMKYRTGQMKDFCSYNCNKCGHYSRDCLLPKRTRKEQRSRVFEERFKRIFCEVMNENNLKLEDFAVEET